MSSSATKFIFAHPKNVSKLVKSPSNIQKSSLQSSKKNISQISAEEEQEIILKLKQKLSNRLNQLKQKLQTKRQQNNLYAESLSHYRPQEQLNTLNLELNKILAQHQQINGQILNCQIVQKNTTPQQYFLFKKKQRMDSFNQSMDELYSHVSQQKNKFNAFLNSCKEEMKHLTQEITELEQNMNKPQKSIYSRRNQKQRSLSPKPLLSKQSQKKKSHKNSAFQQQSQESQESEVHEMIIEDDEDQKDSNQKKLKFSLFQMPKLQFSLKDNVFTTQNEQKSPTSSNFKKKLQSSQDKLHNIKIPMSESINHHLQKQVQIQQSQSSPSQSSVDEQEHYMLKEEYSNLLSTVQILSQNKQILTVQLYDRIENIQESLDNFYQSEKTKIFKEIKQIKNQLSDPKKFANPSSMSVSQPSQSQLVYNAKPLIQDYVNKMAQIGKKLSPELKEISRQLLIPLNWSSINVQSYFQKQGSSKQSTISKEDQMVKLKSESRELEQQIKDYQNSLKQVMSQTVTFKQKQHELQMAMNNMRKMLQ